MPRQRYQKNRICPFLDLIPMSLQMLVKPFADCRTVSSRPMKHKTVESIAVDSRALANRFDGYAFALFNVVSQVRDSRPECAHLRLQCEVLKSIVAIVRSADIGDRRLGH